MVKKQIKQRTHRLEKLARHGVTFNQSDNCFECAYCEVPIRSTKSCIAERHVSSTKHMLARKTYQNDRLLKKCIK